MATGTFIDSRDGSEYPWTTIGSNKWMTTNFRYLPVVDALEDDVNGIWVYGYSGNDENEAATLNSYIAYGALYSNQTAIDLCPEGCRLPTDADWMDLESSLGMNYYEQGLFFWRNTNDEGDSLKSDGGWLLDYNGGNESGFNAIPGGYRGTGQYGGSGTRALFWTSTNMQDRKNAFMRMLSIKENGVYRLIWPSICGLSVRYIVE